MFHRIFHLPQLIHSGEMQNQLKNGWDRVINIYYHVVAGIGADQEGENAAVVMETSYRA